MYKDLLKFQPPGAVNFGISELIDAFTQGKCFSAWHWCAVGPAMITPQLKGKVAVMPLPTFKDKAGKPNRNYIIGGQPWVLNAFNDPEHQRVALDFMKWWFLPETMLAAAHRGLNPCDMGDADPAGFRLDPAVVPGVQVHAEIQQRFLA
jgi:multiple sugar transport system substrate-binding protein